MPKLLKQCSLKWGSYTNPGANRRAEDLEQTDVDKKIIRLKARLDKGLGDFSAHYALKNLAKEEGQKFGLLATQYPRTFSYMAPPGYRDSPELQKRCPRFSFFQWDEAYKKAFYDGFKEIYEAPHSRRIKLPLDKPSPFFTDPCADMIRDQFQIIQGIRSEDGVFDDRTWREKLSRVAAKTANRAAAVGNARE